MRTRRPRPLTFVWRSLDEEVRRRETASFVAVVAVVVDLVVEEEVVMGREKVRGKDSGGGGS